MLLFGFGSVKDIDIQKLSVKELNINIGEYLIFSFIIKNNSVKNLKLRLEYAIYYQKANGTLSKKVYKISENTYTKKTITNIEKKQSFKIISTRKFHLGLHQVAIIANGVEFNKVNFYLMN